MNIRLNGDVFELQKGTNVAELVVQQDLVGQRFAIEINQELVPRTTFNHHIIQAGDEIEIVRAIGGG